MVETLTWIAFGVGLVAGLANTVGVLASAFGDSDYYPAGERDWRYYSLWGLSHTLNVAILVVAVGQWRTVVLPAPMVAGAAVLFVVGFAVAVLAGLDLGVDETQGLTGALRTGGWYRYSRNPQYVGYLLATVTVPVWTGAPLAAPLCGIYVVWWFCFPLAEEPWLREQYGAAYVRYAERVPRFVGRHTLRALLGVDDGESSPSRS